MRRVFLLLVCVLLPAAAAAQITPTYTFTAGTVISSDQVNTNFALLGSALNRTGGTMTGTLLTQQLTPTVTATYDLATTAVRYRDLWLSRNATIGGNLTVVGTITGGSLSASSVSCTGCVGPTELAATAVSAGGYGSSTAIPTFTVDADGRLTAAANVAPQLTLTSTYFSSLSGANVTTLNASNISSGSLADARLSANIPLINASTNTFTGNMVFSTLGVFSWNTKTINTAYLAASDGFVIGMSDCTAGGGVTGKIEITSDASNPPTTKRGGANAIDGVLVSSTVPVKKGDYYKVTSTTGTGSPVYTVYWVPLGTGG